MEEQIVVYSRENIAKVNIFLKDPYVKRFIREEKISQITFVGTVGGLLGLFIGFSFVSVVEMVYICLLGMLGMRKPEKNHGTKRMTLDQSMNSFKKPYSTTQYDEKKIYPLRWQD